MHADWLMSETKRTESYINIKWCNLKQVSTTKYLGVYLNQHLTWQPQVDYVLSSVQKKFYAVHC